MLHVRGLIHCCSSLVRRSWKPSVLETVLQRTAGPYILAPWHPGGRRRIGGGGQDIVDGGQLPTFADMGGIAMDATRRALLGAAALGAGGFALTRAANAAEGNDHGKPGEGGYARNAVQLPPGATVAYHDPKD